MASLVDKTAVAGAAPGLRALPFTLILIAVAIAIFAVGRWIGSSYAFFMGYVVVQYIVLGTAWNILGGYTGYVNFGITAFFAIGAYSSVVLHKLTPVTPLPVMIAVGGVLAGLIGLGTGYLTLRLRGVYFSIATLALAVVVQTLITNWDFVGGARGAYVLRPRVAPLIGGEYVQYLFLTMLASVSSCCRRRAPSNARPWVTASPPSATTRRLPRHPACRR